jgi:hypothetical protein
VSEDKKIPVPYVPFKTFLAAIEGFERHMPQPIDSSAWPSYSGAIKSQLLGAFKFLGLIDEKGNPTPSLKSLVEDKANRKAILRKVLEGSYKPIVSAGLKNMSPRRFSELMTEYGMTGDTQKKVNIFFLKAAKYADIPVSPLLLERAPYTRKKKEIDSRINGERKGDSSESGLNGQSQQGISKTVELRSGGKLTLILEANYLDLDMADRDYVNEITTKLQEYK